MTIRIKLFIYLVIIFALQVSVFPAYIEDPFRPNLFIFFVAYLGLRGESVAAALVVAFLGILQDAFSGLYLGLSTVSYLFIYFQLARLADRLYTDSPYLMVMVVFFSSIAHGFVTFILLLLFSADHGVYSTLFPALLPQSLVNAFCASIMANLRIFERKGMVQ
jgi:rod shape-determining protein MreD